MKYGLVLLIVAAIAGVGAGSYWANAQYGSAGYLSEKEQAQLGIFSLQKTNDTDSTKSVATLEVVNGDTYDFGSGEVDATQKHVFVLKNTGNSKLALKYLESSCKCTGISMKKGEVVYLEPGETKDIELEWKGITEAEFFSQYAKIETNDPNLPLLSLTVKGKLSSNIHLDNQNMIFSTVPFNQPSSQDVTITYLLTDNPPQPTATMADPATDQFFNLEWSKVGEEQLKERNAKAGWRGTLTVKPGLPIGDFMKTIKLDLGPNMNAHPDLFIKGFIAGNVSLESKMDLDRERNILTLGDIPQGKEATFSDLAILLNGDFTGKLKLKTTTVAPEYLRIKFLPEVYSKEYNQTRVPIEISIPADAPPEIHTGGNAGSLGLMLIDLGLDDYPKLRISLKFSVN